MSLVVTLKVPDGIVVAADSLSTAHNILQIEGPDFKITCPNCKKEVGLAELPTPQIPIPFSASSYTDKLFPILKKYAVSTYGLGVINNRSIYYHVKQFEGQNNGLKSVEELKNNFIAYIERELLVQFPNYPQEAPENWAPLSFHINGYEIPNGKPSGVTYAVTIGRKNKIERNDKIGCLIGGDMRLVQKMWEIGKEDKRRGFKYPFFSLQDAIDLSEFLINATSSFQRFTCEVPSVGGAVDIALLTPFHDFQWIRRKKLMETLEESK